jgi:hypothetical protein
MPAKKAKQPDPHPTIPTPKDPVRTEQMAAAHRRLMRLFNPATSRDWIDEVRKNSRSA